MISDFFDFLLNFFQNLLYIVVRNFINLLNFKIKNYEKKLELYEGQPVIGALDVKALEKEIELH